MLDPGEKTEWISLTSWRAQGAKGFTMVLGIKDLTLLSVCAAACRTADIETVNKARFDQR